MSHNKRAQSARFALNPTPYRYAVLQMLRILFAKQLLYQARVGAKR